MDFRRPSRCLAILSGHQPPSRFWLRYQLAGPAISCPSVALGAVLPPTDAVAISIAKRLRLPPNHQCRRARGCLTTTRLSCFSAAMSAVGRRRTRPPPGPAHRQVATLRYSRLPSDGSSRSRSACAPHRDPSADTVFLRHALHRLDPQPSAWRIRPGSGARKRTKTRCA